jgi:ammonia channel protein AmtB
MQAGFTCRNWIYQIKEHREYNNEKFNGFVSVVAFWAIGYSLMYGTSIGSVIGTQVGFDSAADMHSLFFQTVFNCCNNCFWYC